jgi:hypothetical protein
MSTAEEEDMSRGESQEDLSIEDTTELSEELTEGDMSSTTTEPLTER